MTRERAKELLPVIQAWVEGKKIQWRFHDRESWIDSEYGSIGFDNACEFRIKPEPKLRPWRPEEIPIGLILRDINDKRLIRYPRTQGSGWLTIDENDKCKTIYAEDFKAYEYTLDHGKTWLPCGVMEE